MDYLQEGIGLRAVGQRDPLVEYQREGFEMFQGMQDAIKEDFVQYMFHVQVVRDQTPGGDGQQSRLRYTKDAAPSADQLAATAGGDGAEQQAAVVANQPAVVEQARSDKIPRNAPCPCGSGKKYKKCHGLNA
jgi:preprotein translocase subunit SecA